MIERLGEKWAHVRCEEHPPERLDVKIKIVGEHPDSILPELLGKIIRVEPAEEAYRLEVRFTFMSSETREYLRQTIETVESPSP